MTKSQLKYNYNARRCRKLAELLEKYTEEMYFHEKMGNTNLFDYLVSEIADIRSELNVLWAEQVDLFFKIREHK